jgi:hypothetical protein
VVIGPRRGKFICFFLAEDFSEFVIFFWDVLEVCLVRVFFLELRDVYLK